jgi:hypothetical protein
MVRICCVLCGLFYAVHAFERFDVGPFGKRTVAAMEAYTTWHTAQLAALHEGDCTTAQSIVWHPEAGIGDAAFSLVTAFEIALKTGRLLFIDWTMPITKGVKRIHWDAVLTQPFEWDVHAAIDSRVICPAVATPAATAYMIDGDVRAPNFDLVHEEVAVSPSRNIAFSENAMVLFLLRPSQQIRDEYMAATESVLAGSYVITVAMRTGSFEYTGAKFLDDGDELRFVECVEAAMRQLKPEFTAVMPKGVKVFTTSDNQMSVDTFKSAAAEYGWAERIVTMPETTGAITHVNANSSVVLEDGIYRAFAEFFLLGRARISFGTSHSLFGDAAAKRAASSAAAGKQEYLYPIGSTDGERFEGYGGTLARRYLINKHSCATVDPLDPSSMHGVHIYDTCTGELEQDYVPLARGCRAVLRELSQRTREKCPWRAAGAKNDEL